MNATYTKLLTRFTALYYQGWHSVEHQQGRYTLVEQHTDNDEAAGKPIIVVLGRNHYKEWTKEYKAPTAAAVKKMVKLELASKGQSHTNFEIHKAIEGVSKVTFWQLEPDMVAKLPSSVRWVVPESYLLAKPGNIIAAQTPSGTVYVAQQVEVSSSCDTLGCRDIEHFQWMSGVSHAAHQQILDSKQYIQAVLQALGTQVVHWLPQFSVQKTNDFSDIKRQLKPTIAISLGLVTIYMVASSVYLHWHHQGLVEIYQAKSQQINQVLSKQQKVQQQQQTLMQGAQSLSGLELTSPAWQVVLDQLELDVRITQVNYDKGLVILRGNAASATELLTQLTQHPLVQEAKFITAVSRQRNRDRFSISFQLDHNADWKSTSQQSSKTESISDKVDS